MDGTASNHHQATNVAVPNSTGDTESNLDDDIVALWYERNWSSNNTVVYTYMNNPTAAFRDSIRKSSSPSSLALLPCAEWFRLDDDDRGTSTPSSRRRPLSYLTRYAKYVNGVMRSVRECVQCTRYTCWRVAPHVELPNFGERSLLDAMADYARRDTVGMLRFAYRFAVSGLLDRCRCHNCKTAVTDWSETTAMTTTTAAARDPVDLSCFARNDANDYGSNGSGIDAGALSSPPSTPPSIEQQRSDFFGNYCLLTRLAEQVRAWHTGCLGVTMCWLLTNGHIDASRYGAEIESLFVALMQAGAVCLALPFGLYVSRDVVGTGVRQFTQMHMNPLSPMRFCFSLNACWRNFHESVSWHSMATLRVLAAARRITVNCDCDAMTGRLTAETSRAIERKLGFCRQRPMSGQFPLRYSAAAVSKLSDLAIRSHFYHRGAIVGAAHRHHHRPYPARLERTVDAIGRDIARYCCDKIFIETILLDEEMMFRTDNDDCGGGRCDPCVPRVHPNHHHRRRCYSPIDVA